MKANTINKYKDKSTKKLRDRAVYYFNKFIRERDSTDGFGVCISSGQFLKVPSNNAQAGHYYSAGKYPQIRFNEDNVHLQGKSDNYFNGGNLLEYRKNLINKIGLERVEKLDLLASNKNPYRLDRFFLISIIEKYK